MDINQNNDELQKAIDGITDAAANNTASEIEQQIQDQMGMPPAPAFDAGMPPVPEPLTPAEPVVPEAAAPALDAAPVLDAAPAIDAPTLDAPTLDAPTLDAPAVEAPALDVAPALDAAPAVAPVEAAAAGNLESVKAEMMKELFPLMDKVQMESDEKFGIYQKMIDETNDDNMIPDAYQAAKGITDETKKAEALLYLIRKTED